MKVHVFLVCYNEELLLPKTVAYYQSRFPNGTITIFDNHSTDRSCAIAEEMGCNIRTFDTNGQQNEKTMMWVRSNLWKECVTEGWIIMCDMDEWIDITESQLQEEDKKGTTMLMTQGVNMIGESQKEDCSDIVIGNIVKGCYDDNMSKRVCFKHPDVSPEYWWGAHTCFPQGNVVYSQKTYLMRHYNYLGEAYLIQKHKNRYERNVMSRAIGINRHYSDKEEEIRNEYVRRLEESVIIPK